MLYCFFRLRNFPDNYGPCRLFDRPRNEWPLFYGSGYNPHQRARLRKSAHPYFAEQTFRDKELVEGLCKRMGIRVPVTVGALSPGFSEEDVQSIVQQSASDRLIVKPVNGHAGLGITILEKSKGGITFKSKSHSTPAARFHVDERCLVQEIVRQRADIAHIAPASLNTVRLLSVLTPKDEFLVVGTTMRFGRTGAFVDNWSAGGIAVGVEHESGRLFATGYDKRGRPFNSHPDSGVVFGDVEIPGWSELIAFGETVHRSFPFFRIFGMDLAFSDEGIVLIEINNDADLVFQEQTTGPILANRQVWKAFSDYGLLYNAHQSRLHSSN